MPPEVSGVGGAAAVLRPAPGRLPRTAALDRSGIGHPDIVIPRRGVGAQHPDHVPDQATGITQPPVVARLPGQMREHHAQLGTRVPQPAPLRDEARKRRQHRQCHQLGITEPRRDTDLSPPRSQAAGPSTHHRSARTVRLRGCLAPSSHIERGHPRPNFAATPRHQPSSRPEENTSSGHVRKFKAVQARATARVTAGNWSSAATPTTPSASRNNDSDPMITDVIMGSLLSDLLRQRCL